MQDDVGRIGFADRAGRATPQAPSGLGHAATIALRAAADERAAAVAWLRSTARVWPTMRLRTAIKHGAVLGVLHWLLRNRINAVFGAAAIAIERGDHLASVDTPEAPHA